MIYKAMYKCRLCGKVFHDGARTGRGIALNVMMNLIVCGKPLEPQAPSMQTVHFCGSFENGDIGMADFIGWEEEPET